MNCINPHENADCGATATSHRVQGPEGEHIVVIVPGACMQTAVRLVLVAQNVESTVTTCPTCVVCSVAALVLQELAVQTWSSQMQSSTFLVCVVQIKTEVADQPNVDWSGMSVGMCPSHTRNVPVCIGLDQVLTASSCITTAAALAAVTSLCNQVAVHLIVRSTLMHACWFLAVLLALRKCPLMLHSSLNQCGRVITEYSQY